LCACTRLVIDTLAASMPRSASSAAFTVAAMPDSDIAARYRAIARNTAARLSLQARNKSISFPKIVVQNT
jgi:hypothetical protein